MSKRHANAIWEGTLKEGSGTMTFDHFSGPYTNASRFEEGEGTNPEEMVGAAIAGCFSMFLAALISKEGLKPKKISTRATVQLEKDETGPLITNIRLENITECEGLSKDKFDELVLVSKKNCPVSRLYQGGTASIAVVGELAGTEAVK